MWTRRFLFFLISLKVKDTYLKIIDTHWNANAKHKFRECQQRSRIGTRYPVELGTALRKVLHPSKERRADGDRESVYSSSPSAGRWSRRLRSCRPCTPICKTNNVIFIIVLFFLFKIFQSFLINIQNQIKIFQCSRI